MRNSAAGKRLVKSLQRWSQPKLLWSFSLGNCCRLGWASLLVVFFTAGTSAFLWIIWVLPSVPIQRMFPFSAFCVQNVLIWSALSSSISWYFDTSFGPWLLQFSWTLRRGNMSWHRKQSCRGPTAWRNWGTSSWWNSSVKGVQACTDILELWWKSCRCDFLSQKEELCSHQVRNWIS